MNDDDIKAAHFKERAEKLRSFAEQDQNPQTRQTLLSIALAYDRLSEEHASGVTRSRRR